LNDRVIKFLRIFGLNRAIGYGVMARAWSFVSGPVTIWVIASRFSKEQQGFYFTISSLLALQVFFELGLITVLAQFTSHEFAHLTWGNHGSIEGDPAARERLIDIMCKSVKWFATVALLLAIVLIPVGLVFLNRQSGAAATFAWRLPWVLAVCGTAMNLMIVPFFAVVMGSGDVVTVNHREMMGALVSSLISWSVIGLHGGVYAVFAITCGTFLVSISYLIKRKPQLLKLAWNGIFGNGRNRIHTVSWRDEVWPMQWKIALSWIAGYFIFQLFTPVLFHYHGAIVAGQMGMTLSVSNALLAGSATWMSSRSPEFGKMVAKHEWAELDAMFYRVLRQSIGVVVTGACIGWGVIAFFQAHYQIGHRFIPATQAGIMFAAICAQVGVSSFAIYLRAHKKEPFMWLSVVLAPLQGVLTWYLGMRFSSIGVVVGFLAINLFLTLPAAYIIFRRCRSIWHAEKA
jgi:O-antigen/teichoic acid export membrane protein